MTANPVRSLNGDLLDRLPGGGRGRTNGLRRTIGCVISLLVFLPSHGACQDLPHTMREFLTRYQGKEILLLDYSPDMREFADQDSLLQYRAVLESVSDQEIIVRHIARSDRRSLSYPLTNVRRVTYLFNGRPYRRIVVETQAPVH